MITLSSVAIVVLSILVLGFIAWIIETAPFISAAFKPYITWALLLLAGFVLIVFLFSLFGVGPGITLR